MKTLEQLLIRYGKDIEEVALKHDLDPCILAGLIWTESRGEPSAISHCGAIGLTQVMPATAKDRGYNLLSPRGQIEAGADYLKWVLDNFAGGDIIKALAGYNAGPGRIRGDKWRKIKETALYVQNVPKAAEEYRKLIPVKDVKIEETVKSPERDWRLNQLRKK